MSQAYLEINSQKRKQHKHSRRELTTALPNILKGEIEDEENCC